MSDLPSLAALDAALEATWPSAATERLGPLTLRHAAGGGKRVGAATLDPGADLPGEALLAQADQQMRGFGQQPLYRLREGEEAFDALLEKRGARKLDPTRFYAIRTEGFARAPRPVSLLPVWPPLAIQRQLWEEAGIGPTRIAVMERSATPRTSFIARFDNRAAGMGFLALDGRIAMLHALEVLPGARRQGVARFMLTGMAHWAAAQGAEWLTLAVTAGNIPARALYEASGMQDCGGYHYREEPAT